MIAKGQKVTFKPEWQDEGDSDITFIAIEDETVRVGVSTVAVMAMLGLQFNPVQVVSVDMIETAGLSSEQPTFRITAEYIADGRNCIARLGHSQYVIDFCIDKNPRAFDTCEFEYAE